MFSLLPGCAPTTSTSNPSAHEAALVRDLADYDTRFGVDFDTIASHDAKEVAV